MEALLAVPSPGTPRGRIEHAVLLFLYNTGARVSEAAGLRVGDVEIGRRGGGHALVTLFGKGAKSRQCPLWSRTEEILKNCVQGRTHDEAVFLSRHHRPYTRFGIYRLVERCAADVPALTGRNITPHSIRHSTAVHLLEAGVEINVIRNWLGHVSLETTNRYAEITLAMKEKALEACAPPLQNGGAFPARAIWRDDPSLLNWLKSL